MIPTRRVSAPRRVSCTLLVAFCFALACGDGATDPAAQLPDGPPGFEIVQSPATVDTVRATPSEVLVVVLRNEAGRPLRGVRVRFEAPSRDALQDTRLRVGPAGTFGASALIEDTTDALGQAQASVRFAERSGAADVIITAVGRADTLVVAFVVQPGAPAEASVEPADTALYVGGTAALRAQVRDRFGNVISPTLSISGPASLDGHVATATAIGRARVIVSAGARSDTSWISVVPEGTIAFAERPFGGGSYLGLSTIELDGSDQRQVYGQFPRYEGGFNSAWSSDGSRLAFFPPNAGGLHIIESDGSLTALPLAQGGVDYWPEFSRDGERVYFAAANDFAGLWRVALDAPDAPEMLLEFPGVAMWQPAVTVAPDEQTAIFATGGTMFRVDLVARTATPLAIRGFTPRLSPSGDALAWISDDFRNVMVAQPDGSGARAVVAQGSFQFGVSWSGDGRWLIVRTPVGLSLIEVATGLELPLGYSRNFLEASWRP